MGKIVLLNQLKRAGIRLFMVVLLASVMVPLGKAQQYEVPVPEDYEFKDAEDYRKYEEDIQQCAEFILSGSLEEDGHAWDEASKWLLKWIIGAPDYTMTIRPEIFDYIHKKNSSLLIYFMAGWVKDAIENQHDNQIEGNVAGMNAMIHAYKDHPGWKKDKNMEKLIEELNSNDETVRDIVRSWFR